MTAPVTSKYHITYWQRLCVFGLLSIGAIGMALKSLFIPGDDGPMVDLVLAFILAIAALGFYLFFFLNSPPRKIVINDQHITIDIYFPRKNIIIQYGEIEHIRTFIQTYERGGRFTSRTGILQIIQMELMNGKFYRMYENDLENFEALKAALRVQMGDHRSVIHI